MQIAHKTWSIHWTMFLQRPYQTELLIKKSSDLVEVSLNIIDVLLWHQSSTFSFLFLYRLTLQWKSGKTTFGCTKWSSRLGAIWSQLGSEAGKIIFEITCQSFLMIYLWRFFFYLWNESSIKSENVIRYFRDT